MRSCYQHCLFALSRHVGFRLAEWGTGDASYRAGNANMSMRLGRPLSIAGIKRHAKQIKAESGLQHARALDEAARLEGFQNFTHAKNALASKGHPAPGRHTTTAPKKERSVTMPRSDFHVRSRADWVRSISSAPGAKASSTTVWHGRSEIAAALTPIMGINRNHAHLPDGGGQDFEAVELSPERGCLDFRIGRRVVYRMKPGHVTLDFILRGPAESFFLLELDQLEPSGVYPDREPRHDRFDGEEVVELSRGEYLPRSVWISGETDDGEELPDDARLVVRFFAGSVMFVTKGSIWNGSSATYDGIHAKMNRKDIRKVIEAIIEKKAARAEA